VLSITAQHKEEKTEKKKNYLRREVAYGTFERFIALPRDVQGDNIKANFKNGRARDRGAPHREAPAQENRGKG